jgi:hypothetical protein
VFFTPGAGARTGYCPLRCMSISEEIFVPRQKLSLARNNGPGNRDIVSYDYVSRCSRLGISLSYSMLRLRSGIDECEGSAGVCCESAKEICPGR